uniref:Uncharacterized protein n=1 Tax=Corethron hystrix TaxID=216773 RepID=A0A7S1BBZ0_9STRA|mmetsp:Transcript_2124/g.4228  ORF Transcript_2124/g.4228 Transcript_2124/m.4228 type:complete len:213 (+) Transcript_2124:215-853(+)
MMLLHGGHNMNTVIWLILVFLKDSVYLASADTDEYQPIRVLAERNIVHKYEGSRKEMVVTMGDANYGEEKQDRRDVTHIRIHNKAIEVGISMVNNLELFLWRQDPRIFEKPEMLSSLIQAEEDRAWEEDESDIFCTLKDSAIKFIKQTTKCDMEYDAQLPNQSINDDDDVESILREAKCGIYLAPSTIPNSGNGMFTGVNVPLETDLVSCYL